MLFRPKNDRYSTVKYTLSIPSPDDSPDIVDDTLRVIGRNIFLAFNVRSIVVVNISLFIALVTACPRG